MTKVIGLTGGIGSGKSTVTRYLAELGAVVIDADKVGHEAFQPNTEAWREVVAAFGQKILAPSGEIDRKKLGAEVFHNPEAMARLNRIMHPRMYRMIEERINALRRQGVDVVVVEAAVFIEAGWKPLVDELWVVVSSEATVLERLQKQRGLAREQILARIKSQLSSEERIKHADAVIPNDSNLDEMRAKVGQLWARLHAL